MSNKTPTVYGFTPTPEQMASALEYMQRVCFTHSVLQDRFHRMGISGDGVAHRLADRLIQRERKAGNIHQIRHAVWEWKQ
jgi:hypothetical protein